MSLPNLRDKLSAAYPAAEGDDFSFAEIDSALAIQIKGTDVHRSLRTDNVSGKDQIDLSYGASLPEGASPVDDFFPTIVRPKQLPQQRHLEIRCRVWGECLPDPAQTWSDSTVDVVRLERNESRNPSLQLRGVNELRKQIAEGQWLIFVHRKGLPLYEAFSLQEHDWKNPNGKTKEMFHDPSGRPSRVDFDFAELEGDAAKSAATSIGANTIYFGPPGTGKSTMVKKTVGAAAKERAQFHPEYSHADFLGSYRPVVGIEKGTKDAIETHDGKDAYRPVNYFAFVPGPLTLALEKAFKSEEHVFLIIEEINRGDCAAIFGDVFQLLDRNDDGRSEFGISPKPELVAYFKSQKIKYDVDGDGLLYLPSNLSLVATMNTSDQSLHPMDSAFKRRWHWVACHVDFDEVLAYTDPVRPFLQDSKGQKYDWVEFLTALNKDIVGDRMEDRQVGPWFIKPDKSGAVSFDAFLNKCLFYLWHDVFKDEQLLSEFSPFKKGGPSTFGDLQHAIRKNGIAAGIKPELLAPYGSVAGSSSGDPGDADIHADAEQIPQEKTPGHEPAEAS
jgi:hypothetical protein